MGEVIGKKEKPSYHKPKTIVIRFKTKEHGQKVKEYVKEYKIPSSENDHLTFIGKKYCSELPDEIICTFMYSARKNQLGIVNDGNDIWRYRNEPEEEWKLCAKKGGIALNKGTKIVIREGRMALEIMDIVY